MHQQILQFIAGAHAQQPARQDVVAKRLKAPEAEVATAVEQLYACHAINLARITRKGESYVAIWPTGVTPAPHEFTINPKKRPPSGSFTRPPRPERGHTVSKSTLPANPKKAVTDLEAGLKTILNGTTADAPMTPSDISELLERTQSSWNPAMARLLSSGVVAATENPKRKGSRAYYLSPSTSPSEAAGSSADQTRVSVNNSVSGGTSANLSLVADAVSTPPPGPVVGAADPGADTSSDAPDVSFAIHDDGRLTITDCDQVLELQPSATRRLGYFLGCLEIQAWPPRFDPTSIEEVRA
ncbi:hypothetical protein AZSI13_32580 [Azospira sp. I13]|uniref:hypothetical protein n=1 Tax=Azospira sp. I13 TaxID=1765050 RepID=UPI000D4BE299|nr:hypothetical protein [Azospira sp. I13]GBG03931.1 hypothetical protein AZSI13_32580 [Azospira sp. I13]